jgi:uncharacterized integral membrane protein
MPVVRVLLIALLMGIAVSLVVQNTAPLIITILGAPTLPISAGLAILGSVLIGILFGAALQYLLRGSLRVRTLGAQQSPQRPWFQRSARQAKARQSKKAASYRGSRSSSNPNASDWHQPSSQDWYGRPPKVSATAYDSRSPEDEDYDDDYDDTPQQSRWSHLFENENGSDSPSRKKKASESDRVVDADYRVLRPPTRPLSDPEWDDEFFEDRR